MLEASASPPPAVIDLLSRHKVEVVALLRPAEDGWSAEDWQVFFDERAGIVEFDGGLPRDPRGVPEFVPACTKNPSHTTPVTNLRNRIASIITPTRGMENFGRGRHDPRC
jgi:hypothetical protein